MDHHDQTPVNGPWPGGWAIAALAGLLAAVLAEWLAVVAMPSAALIGAFVFLVYGVLLGSGGVELTAPDQGHGTPDAGHH